MRGRMTARLHVAVGALGGVLVAAAAPAQQPDQVARSIALFREAGKVLQHPRCLNCHPVGDRPTQTDHMTAHRPMVVRGADGHGAPGLPCNACHHAANSCRVGCARHSTMAPRAAVDGLDRQVAGRDLSPDLGSGAQRRSRHGRPAAACERGHAGRLGVGAGRQTDAGTGHAGGIRRHNARVGRGRSGLSARLSRSGA